MLAEKIFAALGLLTCILMGLHMAIGPVRRARLRLYWLDLLNRIQRLRWQSGAERKQARHAATAAIRRAQLKAVEREDASEDGQDEDWDGNVYSPEKFEERRKKRKLH